MGLVASRRGDKVYVMKVLPGGPRNQFASYAICKHRYSVKQYCWLKWEEVLSSSWEEISTEILVGHCFGGGVEMFFYFEAWEVAKARGLFV